jgi:flagellar protein FliS
MYNRSGLQKYKSTAVQTASREQLLLMMYAGAIKFIKLAKNAIAEGDIAAKGVNIGRAHDIVSELNNTLDHSVGGQISSNLEQLYMFMIDQLFLANLNNDPEPLDVVQNLLQTLCDGWREAIKQLKVSKKPGEEPQAESIDKTA